MAEIEIVRYKKGGRRKRRRSKDTGEFIYSRRDLEKKLWSTFSLFIRLRDKACVQGPRGCRGNLQAGHVISRRKLPTKYDENNVFGQCAGHNWAHKFRSPHPYINWYIQKFGAGQYQELVYRSEQPSRVMTKGEIQRAISYFEKRISEAVE